MKEPNLIVITMVQAKDFPSAWSSLRPLGTQLSSERRRIVLLNDIRNPDLEASLRSLPFTTLLTPGANLGVARGRNALFEAALTRGADYIVSLDDDLYIPSDYLEIIHRVAVTADETLGIFAPTVMNFVPFANENPDLVGVRTAVEGHLIDTEMSSVLRGRVDPKEERMFYHLGVRNWMAHYLEPSTATGRGVRERLANAGFVSASGVQKTTFLRSDAESRAIAAIEGLDELQWVDTIPGGVSVFNAAMLRSIGVCDERFSPFGYEDADLCVRAVQAGYRNAWIPTTVVLHDFQDRGVTRSPEHLAFVYGRAKALLAANHVADGDLPLQITYALSSYAVDAQAVARHKRGCALDPERILASVASFAYGYISGASIGDTDRPALLDRLAGMSAGYALALRQGRRWILHRFMMGNTSMSPVLSADVTVEDGDVTSTAATINLRFPEGLTGTFRCMFVSDSPGEYASVRVRHLSIQASGNGCVERRFVGDTKGWDDVPFDGLHTNSPASESVMRRETRHLVSPSGGKRRGALRIDPRPPVTLEQLASIPMNTATGIVRLGAATSTWDATHRAGVDIDG